MPNADDMDYALFSLDEKSLGYAKTALSTLPEPLSRLMLWYILGQMVRDEELGPKEFIQLATTALKVEQDDMLLGLLLGRHSQLRDQYSLYLDKEVRGELAPHLEEVLWSRVESAKPGSSLQMTFFDFLVSLGQTPAFQTKLHEMLTKNAPPQGITLDQDRRWAILLSLGRNGHPEAEKLIRAEEKLDPSTAGKRMALVGRASLPDKKIKAQFWKEFKKDGALPYSNFKEAAEAFTGTNHTELTKPYVKEFFDILVKKDWKKHDSVVDIFFERLFPVEVCDKETLSLSETKLKRAKNLSNLAERSWLEAHDELSRCVRVRSHVKNQVKI